MALIIKKGRKPVRLEAVVVEPKPVMWTTPSDTELSSRTPSDIAILVAKTLARQAARADHKALHSDLG